jgi:hypothetical protein
MAEQKTEPPQQQARQVAIKSWIKTLVNGQYIVKDGWEPNYIQYNGQKISRANIMGIIVQKSDSKLLNYEYIVIDDGSSRITARSFEDKDKFINFAVGDVVNVIGRPREFGREIYIIPEIVRNVKDNRWLEVRKLELGDAPEKEPLQQNVQDIEVEEIETPQERLIKIINDIDDGSGVDIDEAIRRAKNPHAEDIIKDMLAQGDIFEIKPGRIKVLE